MRRLFRYALWLIAFLGLFLSNASFAARDASFIDPGLSSQGRNGPAGDAITIEPKSEIDTGESIVNISRRITLFFANNTIAQVGVVSLTAAGDGNVKSVIVSDDCSKEGSISPSSRCSVVVEVTPTSAGAWTVEVLMTHDGVGRIAKAKLIGKTSGQVDSAKKDSGLSLSTKDIKPIDFESVDVGEAKAVRSALMINDSAETITLLSIDVIAAENGLERLEQGCAVDMDLKPGESCPVTLVWKPVTKGQVSTDLIIRHSGKMGFSVIPVRGVAKADEKAESKTAKVESKENVEKTEGNKKQPSTADELQRVASDKIPPLAADMLPLGVASNHKATPAATEESTTASQSFHLIGTVGNRVVLLKPEGNTIVVEINEEIPYDEGKTAKITNVLPKEAEIFMDGKKKRLVLEAASQLTSKAANSAKSKDSDSAESKGNKKSSSKNSAKSISEEMSKR